MRLLGRGGLVLAIGLLATGVGIVLYLTHVFAGLELDTVDTRYEIRGTAAEHRLALVLIDDATFDRLEEQWPFPRSMHGRVIRKLTRAGAEVIAYDVQFTEPTVPREDNALISAVRAADEVVLSTTEVDRSGKTRIFGGGRGLRFSRGRPANTVVEADDDGVLRRIHYSHDGLVSFAAASAEAAGAGAIDPDSFPGDGAWIDFAGPSGSIPAASFGDVLRGAVDPAMFEGRTVVVGASATSLQDVHAVPLGGGDLMPGAEVNANAIATLLDGMPLHSPSRAIALILIALFGFLAPLVSLRLLPLHSLLLVLTAAGAYLLLAQAAFEGGLVLPVVHPLIALVAGTIGALGMQYALAAFERQRVRDTFARFVPGEVVEMLMADVSATGEVHVGGVRKQCTVLFSDIRGFTSYAETTPADEVVEVLNRYLGTMTDAIMDHGGTLVSYMGDGIMAVFGAPIDQTDHADRALAAAREMLDRRLAEFNAWMAEGGRGKGFRIGIGLNSGEVMSGQVGSLRRMEYTTIGDTVNTASRLEGMTKGTPHEVFISESTRAALQRDLPELVLVGDMEVRGRERAIRIWSLPGSEGRDDDRATQEHAEALVGGA